MLKVKGHNNVFFDVNNGYISVQPQVYPTSLSDQELEQIKIHPNPARHTVSIENLPTTTETLRLFTLNGQEIKHFAVSDKIDVHELANGMYFLKISLNSGREFVKKIVIQK